MPYLYRILENPTEDELTDLGLRGYRHVSSVFMVVDQRPCVLVTMECEIGMEAASKMRDKRLSDKAARDAGIPPAALRYFAYGDDGNHQWEMARTNNLGEAVDFIYMRRDHDISYHIFDARTGRIDFRLPAITITETGDVVKRSEDEPL